MYRSAISFTNELGNSIDMSVTIDGEDVTVYAKGPTSTVEHTWTIMEAETLHDLLRDVLMY
jgi:hypothetical protein